MGTVLITYSASGRAGADISRGGSVRTAAGARRGSLAPPDEGVDLVIATMSGELAAAGHDVMCRPDVGAPTAEGFDLVICVRAGYVTHRAGPLRRHLRSAPVVGPPTGAVSPAMAMSTGTRRPALPDPGMVASVRPKMSPTTLSSAGTKSEGDLGRTPSGNPPVPTTGCVGWRPVQVWARTLGEHLERYLRTQDELALVQAELVRCEGLLVELTSSHCGQDRR